jgi:hypothetical protein
LRDRRVKFVSHLHLLPKKVYIYTSTPLIHLHGTDKNNCHYWFENASLKSRIKIFFCILNLNFSVFRNFGYKKNHYIRISELQQLPSCPKYMISVNFRATDLVSGSKSTGISNFDSNIFFFIYASYPITACGNEKDTYKELYLEFCSLWIRNMDPRKK